MVKLFEELAQAANAKGWFVLNCFQFANFSWRCNLQQKAETGATRNVFSQYADGRTPSEALRACMANMESGTSALIEQPVEAPIKHVRAAKVDTPTTRVLPQALTLAQASRIEDAMGEVIEALIEFMDE